jgi:hypothetical protein
VIAFGWSPLFAAGIDWLEALLPILFVGFWIVSQIVAVIRRISGPAAPNRPEPAARPVARRPEEPIGDVRSELERQIEEFLGQSPAGRAAPPKAIPKPAQQRRPERPRVSPAASSRELPPPLPRTHDNRMAGRQLVATGAAGGDVARHVHDAFAQELGHLSSPLTQTRAAGKAAPVAGRIQELVAAVRHPTKIRELMLLREILDRPVDNWS